MEQPAQKNEPLRDVFATQGILVVLFCILVTVLHLAAPGFCGEMLHLLKEWLAAGPTAEELAAEAAEWFASIFSA